MTPKIVLFDLDGTLVDTAPDFVLAANALRRDLDMGPKPADVISRAVSNGSVAVTETALDITRDSNGFENHRIKLLEHYAHFLGQQSEIYPALNNSLKALEYKGIPWGVVTNKPVAYAEPLMNSLGLALENQSDIAKRCSALICPDHVGTPKPDPEGILKACADLGFDGNECIYVGDHQRDIEAGQRAGATTIAVCYGYLSEHDNPYQWRANHTVETSKQLSELLNALL